MSWQEEYDRRVASGAPTRFAGELGYRQVQDDRGNWFHRAPGNIDCPCGRDERTGGRVEPWVAAPQQDGEMIDGHYVPFWRREEFEAERAAARTLTLAPEPGPAPAQRPVSAPVPVRGPVRLRRVS